MFSYVSTVSWHVIDPVRSAIQFRPSAEAAQGPCKWPGSELLLAYNLCVQFDLCVTQYFLTLICVKT